jgi:Cu(I)/Ag(I) efflux system membrane protein CusA/SilA
MIAGLIRVSARHRIATLLAAIALAGAGALGLARLPLDAIPDLSDTQVIVVADFPGQAPQVVEDQVTFPLSSALLSVPRARVVRGFSYFGVSFVYVVFEDGTDPYWARARVLEYLNTAARRLPAGVVPALGPDATGVGWVYQYALVGGGLSLAELRALQDWTLRFALAKAEGVAEIATVGGFVRQYQVVVDPQRLRFYGIALERVIEAVRAASQETGGRVVALAETEFMVRGRGYVRSVAELEDVPLMASGGAAVRLKDVARIALGPDERRGLGELDGEGEAVSGIVVQRHGMNALATIRAVKQEIERVAAALPEGVRLVPVYDRSDLIRRAIGTLTWTLIEESAVVALVCLVFLLHARSALVAVAVLPLGVLIALGAMRVFGIGSDIMSLGGIAIAIGAMVDAAIVLVENAHKRLERAPPDAPRLPILIDAAAEVGPSLFFSLLIVTVSFLPIFALESQEGRLFAPLAFTKTFAMAAAALLSVTAVPALMVLLLRRTRPRPEAANPVNRALQAGYRPLIAIALGRPRLMAAAALAVVAGTAWPLARLGVEFMPNLDEGTLLFMPTTPPGLTMAKAGELAQLQNKIIRSFPEVAAVYAKAGRATTATDPAPTEMLETVVALKPRAAWRPGMTPERLVGQLDRALRLPGVTNAFTMPIKARIDMLATGIRTPLGLKIVGPTLAAIEIEARRVEAALRRVPGTRSVFSERVLGAFYLEIEPDRAALARLGLSVARLNETVAVALGGETVATVVAGRERIGVSVRYPRELRDSPEAILDNVLITLPNGGMVPLGQVATARRAPGPAMVRTENAQLVGYVFVDIEGSDIGGYVRRAEAALGALERPAPGVFRVWSGQFEAIERAATRLAIVVPLTLLAVALLLYLNFRTLGETVIVLLTLPFALTGGVWLTWALGYNISVAVVVGFIALAGLAAQTGVVMLLYIRHALDAARAAAGRRLTPAERLAAIADGAVERLRPKTMTVAAVIAGLLPILWSDGTGAEVMRRIAVPMVGGMLSSAALTLLVIPAVCALMPDREPAAPAAPAAAA